MVRRLPRLLARRHSIALVGIDGSGKSTQARWLAERLRAQHSQALLIHPFGRKLLSFLPVRPGGATGGGAAPDTRSRRAPGTATWPRRLAAIAELLDIGVYVWAANARSLLLSFRADRDVWLVSDRSFDDLLVKHRRLGTIPPRLLATAQRLVPAVERTIWLHTEPEVAMRRDGEFSAAYYQELHTGYMLAAGQHGWDVICTSGRPRDAIAADIGRLLGLDTRGRAADGSIAAGQAPLATVPPLRSAETAVVRDP